MPDNLNRQWVMVARPTGMVSARHFDCRETPIPEPQEAEVLVRNLYLSFDPAQRVWMNAVPSYVPPVEIGEVMRALSVGQVVKSRHGNFVEGDLVQGMGGWQEYFVAGQSSSDMVNLTRLPKDVAPTLMLSVLGITGLTAYFGLLRVGEAQSGQTVLVSGAAGATGSIASQIARIKGCYTVGVAGGPEKCAWLTEKAGLSAAIDYKNENIRERLHALCPKGVNLYFENVGGDVQMAAFGCLAVGARVVLCGSLSSYNSDKPAPGPDLGSLVVKRARAEGFIVTDYSDEFDAARSELLGWIREGKITYQEDIQTGFDRIPATLCRLFQGRNLGKQLLKLADPD